MLNNRRKHFIFKIIVSVIITTLIMIMPNYILAKEKGAKIGDINGDGNVNLTDLVLMLRHIATKKTNKNKEWILTEKQIKAGDIVKNNQIDTNDVLALLRYIAASKSSSISQKHKEWLELIESQQGEEVIEKKDNIGPKVEKIEAISKEGDYNTGSEIQIKVTFDEKIYAGKNKIALTSKTAPNLNISFGEGEIKHLYAEENKEISTDIIYKYQITSEDKGTLKVDGKKAFDGTKTIYDEAGNETTLITGRDLTGNTITANETINRNNITKIVLDKKEITLDLNGTRTANIIATVEPNETKITWTSSNSKVATIDEKTGTVTALEVGETNMIAKATDGTTASCKVIVQKSEIEATSITLNKKNLMLNENDGERLIATIQPSNVTNQTITWSSADASIAIVNDSGFVTAKKEGMTTITVKTQNGKTATCQVTVKNPIIEVTAVGLNKANITLDKGTTENLTVTVKPDNATNKNIEWTTSNSEIAKVNHKGQITAIRKGTAMITATSSNGRKASCKVTVKDEVIKKLDGKNITLPMGDKVYFLDTQYVKSSNKRVVGSDCIIIESNGKYGMIDTATSTKSSRIVKYLKELKIKELEFVLITHAHSDHIGGYAKVNKTVKIKKLYIKNRNKSSCQNTIKLAKKSGTKICYVSKPENQRITLGNINFKLYNTSDNVGKKDINENVNSVVALAIVNNKTIYFTGDIGNYKGINAENNAAKQVQRDLKAMGKSSVDIYKAAHHSYNENNAAEALKRIQPQNVIVTNQKNRPGTPDGQQRLKNYVKKLKGKMYYTESGTVVLNISNEGNITFKQLANYY